METKLNEALYKPTLSRKNVHLSSNLYFLTHQASIKPWQGFEMVWKKIVWKLLTKSWPIAKLFVKSFLDDILGTL